MITKTVLAGFTAFCCGLMVSCGVFAFIAAIGIVPRLAYKTHTFKFARLYEEVIILGGIFGCGTIAFDYDIPLGEIASGAAGLLSGVFMGSLAVCLAEVLYVMPVLARRTGIRDQIPPLIIAFGLGKLAGSLVYFFVPGFV